MRWKRTTPLPCLLTLVAVVPDRQRVRDRDAGGVGQRDVEVGETVAGRPGGDLTVELDVRPALTAANDLDVRPAHSLSDTGAEGLQNRFLRGEPARHVLGAAALAAAVVPL